MGCVNKFVLFVTNFIVFAAGVAVVVLSSIVISKDSTYGILLKEGTFSLPIVVLIAGLIILFIGFLGCCGAMKESACLLYTYAVIVLILLIGEIVLGIMVLVYTNQANDIVENGMDAVFNDYGGSDPSTSDAIDKAQNELQCCGVANYTDWEHFNYGKKHPLSVADGCCKGSNYTKGCGINILRTHPSDFDKYIYTEGCFEAIKEDIKGAAIGLGVACLLLATVQAFSVAFACQIAKKS